MFEILSIPGIRDRLAPITIERYHRMIDLGVFDEWNVELLNGVLVEKMSKSALHVFIVNLLWDLLRGFCSEPDFGSGKKIPSPSAIPNPNPIFLS